MARLIEVWVESSANQNPAIIVDWDNDRHQRIEIEGEGPADVIAAFNKMARELQIEALNGDI